MVGDSMTNRLRLYNRLDIFPLLLTHNVVRSVDFSRVVELPIKRGSWPIFDKRFKLSTSPISVGNKLRNRVLRGCCRRF